MSINHYSVWPSVWDTPIPTFISVIKKLWSYLYRFGLRDNPMCPCEEEEEETADHLIFKCNKLNKQRKEMIKK